MSSIYFSNICLSVSLELINLYYLKKILLKKILNFKYFLVNFNSCYYPGLPLSFFQYLSVLIIYNTYSFLGVI